jgi:hypothetical protein
MTNTTNLKQLVTAILKDADSEIIDNFFESEMSDEYNSDYDNEEFTAFRDELAENKISFEHMDNHGGEGEGEDYWSVYKFTKGTAEVFVKFSGWYQSYIGSEFDEFFFVAPKEVMVTQYFKVEE